MRRHAFQLVGMDDGGHGFPIDPQGARHGAERGPALEPADDLQPFELGHVVASKSRASAATAVATLARRVNRGPSTTASCGVTLARPSCVSQLSLLKTRSGTFVRACWKSTSWRPLNRRVRPRCGAQSAHGESDGMV